MGSTPTTATNFNMKQFKKKVDGEPITYFGIEYAFLIDEENGVAVRRLDGNIPTLPEISKLSHYILSEGWADDLIDNEEDFY